MRDWALFRGTHPPRRAIAKSSFLRKLSEQALAIGAVVVAKASSSWNRESVASVIADQVEGEMAHDGKVLGGVSGADTAGILAKSDIETPMEGIFDAPM